MRPTCGTDWAPRRPPPALWQGGWPSISTTTPIPSARYTVILTASRSGMSSSTRSWLPAAPSSIRAAASPVATPSSATATTARVCITSTGVGAAATTAFSRCRPPIPTARASRPARDMSSSSMSPSASSPIRGQVLPTTRTATTNGRRRPSRASWQRPRTPA